MSDETALVRPSSIKRRIKSKRLTILFITCHIIACCVSLIYVARRHSNPYDPFSIYLSFNSGQLASAVYIIAAFGLVSCVFLHRRFSFGYFVGFYLYTMVLGYLWLNSFSLLNYNHTLSAISAIASMLSFLLPATMSLPPLTTRPSLSLKRFGLLLNFILVLSLVTILAGAQYNFKLVYIDRIYEFRETADFPVTVRYLIGIVSSALLPFAFAAFVIRSQLWKAGASLVLLLLFFPITLTKTALLAPFWLVSLAIASNFFSARICVLLSLLVPILIGITCKTLFNGFLIDYFDIVNFRMIAVPSIALNIYSDYFSTHELTHFCQISVLKLVLSCPYHEQLSVLMEQTYGLGKFNASMFATEGIASVGQVFAPFSAFVGGLVMALGNRMSSHLPSRFVLLSGAQMPLLLLNVPLTVGLATHGLIVLFFLWLVTPRVLLFEKLSP